ncbi:uncharacterized protein LOC133031358 [Cannabis sativa]|uniref:uncharacterized protein LOC133031358 n=1 Tax=Cannabis sativa TaxID=3483 RepID=UPI0029CA006F|nr:uncharacterized protein LOC133031358 [Cannabis sativa]
MNYYTKWVDVEPLMHIAAKQVVSFVNRFIIFSFGVPYKIITNNGTQFGDLIGVYYDERGIHRGFLAVVHPQANGQVEGTNKVIMKNLKTRLEKLKGAWVEELLNILWAYRTTPVQLLEKPHSP